VNDSETGGSAEGSHPPSHGPAAELLRRCGYGLLAFEGLLGIAHFLWPEMRWGQGRSSYFHLDNSLTLASWLASMQLLVIALFALVALWRERQSIRSGGWMSHWVWGLGAVVALLLSMAEITRLPARLELLGFPTPDIYQGLVVFSLWLATLLLFGSYLIGRSSSSSGPDFRHAVTGFSLWGLHLLATALVRSDLVPGDWALVVAGIRGLALLSGTTLVLMAVGEYALRGPASRSQVEAQELAIRPLAAAGGVGMLAGVGLTTLTLIALQVILFQVLTISGDYLTAQSVIAAALMGISLGGLVGFLTAGRAAARTLAASSLLLPLSIVTAFGASVTLTERPMVAALLLMFPFAAGSVLISIALVRYRSHVVYFIDLLGAAVGALLVSPALGHFREESSILLLSALSSAATLCFVASYPRRRLRWLLAATALAATATFSLAALANLEADRLNVVRTKLLQRYPQGKVLFSASSLVGRYDVVRRRPDHTSLSAYENGRITDTIRNRPPEQYRIDPRVPHTLMEDPVILILGISGDGITKTARSLGSKVFGVEINPAVVQLQTGALIPYNSDAYRDIEYEVVDGRTYIEESTRSYDMITLLNAHAARGRTSGRSPSPEYLHTREAMVAYLRHLTERGLVNIEEPVSRPRREPPVWKLVLTMREALLAEGRLEPERHFFIFQWKTGRNNYLQILMKKSPFSGAEIANLEQWLDEVDRLPETERQQGRELGPIRARTTLLYAPERPSSTIYSRLVRGEVDDRLVEARNLVATTDERPFHFDVDPLRPDLKQAYSRTLVLALILAPVLLLTMRRYRQEVTTAAPYFLVVSLTGFGYLLIEIVLIQRYEILLGSPVATFATVLGTLLVFSGLGSLASGRMRPRAVYVVLAFLVLLLFVHLHWNPALLFAASVRGLGPKIAVSILSIAPLGFLLGVPFPFVLRQGQERIAPAAAAILFALNAAASAVAVPLALNLATAHGLAAVFGAGILIYLAVGLAVVALDVSRLAPAGSWVGALLLLGLVAAPWWAGRPAREELAAGVYRVYGVSYGSSTSRESRVLEGGSKSERVPFEWLFWIVRNNERTLLVDTGSDDVDEARRRGIERFTPPLERLRQLGISPLEVSDVVLTHAHWDHMGNLTPYRNAKIWIQEAELEYAVSLVSEDRPSRSGVRWEHVRQLLEAETEGRLVRVQGEARPAPGVHLRLGGGHSPGSQYVVVNATDGPVVIAGDEAYVYENIQWHEPIGSASYPGANLLTIREMHGLALSPFFILPGHDPRVMDWFPNVSKGVVEIAAVGR
jgi:glyoxylase-like metal-dependent hydrolase (beta-lactamase superfamily II)/predicted membrane-bound spermidine synthase